MEGFGYIPKCRDVLLLRGRRKIHRTTYRSGEIAPVQDQDLVSKKERDYDGASVGRLRVPSEPHDAFATMSYKRYIRKAVVERRIHGAGGEYINYDGSNAGIG